MCGGDGGCVRGFGVLERASWWWLVGWLVGGGGPEPRLPAAGNCGNPDELPATFVRRDFRCWQPWCMASARLGGCDALLATTLCAVRRLLATVLFFVRCVLQSSCRDVRVRRVMTRCVVSGAWCHQALVQPSTCMYMHAVASSSVGNSVHASGVPATQACSDIQSLMDGYQLRLQDRETGSLASRFGAPKTAPNPPPALEPAQHTPCRPPYSRALSNTCPQHHGHRWPCQGVRHLVEGGRWRHGRDGFVSEP